MCIKTRLLYNSEREITPFNDAQEIEIKPWIQLKPSAWTRSPFRSSHHLYQPALPSSPRESIGALHPQSSL